MRSADSQFGRTVSVSLDGRVTFVAAPYQTINTRPGIGAVFISDTYSSMDDPTWHGGPGPSTPVPGANVGYSYDYSF